MTKLKMRWARFIRDDELWSDEFERIYSDSQDRIAAMRAAGRDELDDDIHADLSLPTEVTPGLPGDDDQELQPNPGAEEVGGRH